MKSTNAFQNMLNGYLGEFHATHVEPLAIPDSDEETEAEILIDQLSEEIAVAIGGTPDLYRNAATKIVMEIPEFSFLGNWAIDVTAPGYACKVTTDAGTTIVISPVFDTEDSIQYDDECRDCENVAVGNTGYCHECTTRLALVCCRHCGDPTGTSIPICDSCDDRMSRL